VPIESLGTSDGSRLGLSLAEGSVFATTTSVRSLGRAALGMQRRQIAKQVIIERPAIVLKRP
jgi:hypothetical protein